jgi:hypothetical protein
LTPHVKEHFTDQVLGSALVTHETQHEPVNAHMVPREQHLHREPVTGGYSSDQDIVCRRLHHAPTVGS